MIVLAAYKSVCANARVPHTTAQNRNHRSFSSAEYSHLIDYKHYYETLQNMRTYTRRLVRGSLYVSQPLHSYEGHNFRQMPPNTARQASAKRLAKEQALSSQVDACVRQKCAIEPQCTLLHANIQQRISIRTTRKRRHKYTHTFPLVRPTTDTKMRGPGYPFAFHSHSRFRT